MGIGSTDCKKRGAKGMNINKMVRYYRKQKGYTQKDLADELGITEMAVSLYELGKRNIKADTLFKIANFLDEPIEKFYMDYKSKDNAGG